MLPVLCALALLEATPDWVSSGGRSAKHPPSAFLTGFAMSGSAEAAKNQAAADLAKRILVRIEQSTTDATVESSGGSKYEIAMVTRATTDVKVGGLEFLTHAEGKDAYAFAFVSRDRAAAQLAGKRDQALAGARACLDSAKVLGEKKAAGPALRAFLGCQPGVVEAIEADAVVRAIDAARATAADELAKLHRAVEDGVQANLQRKVASMDDAVGVIVAQLEGLAGRFSIAPFTYGTTSFSSIFGQHLAELLGAALAKQSGGGDFVVRGTYAELDADLGITLTVRDLAKDRPVGGARVVLPAKAVPSSIPIKPQNFEDALKSAKLIGEGEALSGDLRLEVWTNKGDQNLVFRAGEELRIKLRVNKPAYVRLIYVMANGGRLPLEQAYYIDTSKVNRVVEYPDAFEVSPPFGVEHLFAVATTEKPEPLPTEPVNLDGEPYEIVSEQAMVRHRAVKRKKQNELSEARFTITTTP